MFFGNETGILPSVSHSQAAANEPIIDDLIRDFDFLILN